MLVARSALPPSFQVSLTSRVSGFFDSSPSSQKFGATVGQLYIKYTCAPSRDAIDTAAELLPAFAAID